MKQRQEERECFPTKSWQKNKEEQPRKEGSNLESQESAPLSIFWLPSELTKTALSILVLPAEKVPLGMPEGTNRDERSLFWTRYRPQIALQNYNTWQRIASQLSTANIQHHIYHASLFQYRQQERTPALAAGDCCK